MSNEISINETLRYSKSGVTASHSSSFQADQTGDKYAAGVQTVGTAEESLDKNDVGTIGFLAVRNNDDTNFVQLGATTTVYTVKLFPGQGALIPWNGSTTFIKANVAPCDVEYLMVEL